MSIHLEHLIVFGAVLMPGWLYLYRRHLDKRYMLAHADRSAPTLASAIRMHREQVEAAGTVAVADPESRAAAQTKHRADQRLWSYVSEPPESHPW